jgi:translation initiation factor 2B subunit (eIF-2B alpha/beta/delta family)
MPERRFEYAELARRQRLPEPDDATMDLLWKIVDEGVLGASLHVELAHRLLVHLAQPGLEDGLAFRQVSLAARFIARTRGRDAPIVANAIAWLLSGLDGTPALGLRAALTERAERWAGEARARQARLVEQAAGLLGADARLVTFDYSSTVAAIVIALQERGLRPRPLVPESRAIAGGKRYLDAFLKAGIDPCYVLDAAMEQILDKADAVLLGCESVRCDGSLVNTVGSLPLAKLARLRGMPVYGCADLYKLDMRSYSGELRQPALRSFDQVLLDGIAVPPGRRVDTIGAELEVVPPEAVTAFLTELGPVPPAEIGPVGRSQIADLPAARTEAP